MTKLDLNRDKVRLDYTIHTKRRGKNRVGQIDS